MCFLHTNNLLYQLSVCIVYITIQVMTMEKNQQLYVRVCFHDARIYQQFENIQDVI